jgi:hypothetical protein
MINFLFSRQVIAIIKKEREKKNKKKQFFMDIFLLLKLKFLILS